MSDNIFIFKNKLKYRDNTLKFIDYLYCDKDNNNDDKFFINNYNIYYKDNESSLFTFNIDLEFNIPLEDCELHIYINNKRMYSYYDDNIKNIKYSTIIPLKKDYFFNIVIKSKNLEDYNIIENSSLIITKI